MVADAAWSRTAVDRFLRARMEKEGLAPSQLASPRTLICRASPRPHRAAADSSRSRGFPPGRKPRSNRRLRKRSTGSFARLAAFRRTVRAALARCSPFHRNQRPGIQLRRAVRLALPRLRDPGLQPRRALRPIRARTHCRRPPAASALECRGRISQRIGHRHGIVSLRRSQPAELRGISRHRIRHRGQPGRHADQGFPGHDGGLRALPRSQAGCDFDQRLPCAARHPAQLAVGATHARRPRPSIATRPPNSAPLKRELRVELAARWRDAGARESTAPGSRNSPKRPKTARRPTPIRCRRGGMRSDRRKPPRLGRNWRRHSRRRNPPPTPPSIAISSTTLADFRNGTFAGGPRTGWACATARAKAAISWLPMKAMRPWTRCCPPGFSPLRCPTNSTAPSTSPTLRPPPAQLSLGGHVRPQQHGAHRLQ